MKTGFYVYEHWRPDRDVCFYVGKGKAKRATNFRRSVRHIRLIEKLKRNGHSVVVKIIEDGLTEAQAFVVEKELIRKHGRIDLKNGTLINMTDGGEGASGCRRSKETIEKMRANAISQWSNPISRKRFLERPIRVHPKEVREKISKALKGKPKTRAHARAAGAGRLGKKNKNPSPFKGRSLPEETIAKISKTKTGKPWSIARRASYNKRRLNQW